MISDISKSIKAVLYERISSPLFGSFFVSWFLWNYKTILIILSSLDVKKKISYIENCIYPDISELFIHGFLGPFLSSVIFILIYPIPAKWVYRYWSNRQKELKEVKQQIEDKTPLTIEESREIRRELLNLESEHEIELDKKITEIDRLKEIITQNNAIQQSLESSNIPTDPPSREETKKKEKKKNPQVSVISNDNNIIYAGTVSAEEIDKLTLRGLIKIGKVDGPAGDTSIFSKREKDAEKLKLIMEDESKLEIFHRLIYSSGSNYKKIDLPQPSDFYLHLVNVTEDILK